MYGQWCFGQKTRKNESQSVFTHFMGFTKLRSFSDLKTYKNMHIANVLFTVKMTFN